MLVRQGRGVLQAPNVGPRLWRQTRRRADAASVFGYGDRPSERRLQSWTAAMRIKPGRPDLRGGK